MVTVTVEAYVPPDGVVEKVYGPTGAVVVVVVALGVTRTLLLGIFSRKSLRLFSTYQSPVQV